MQGLTKIIYSKHLAQYLTHIWHPINASVLSLPDPPAWSLPTPMGKQSWQVTSQLFEGPELSLCTFHTPQAVDYQRQERGRRDKVGRRWVGGRRVGAEGSLCMRRESLRPGASQNKCTRNLLRAAGPWGGWGSAPNSEPGF